MSKRRSHFAPTPATRTLASPGIHFSDRTASPTENSIGPGVRALLSGGVRGVSGAGERTQPSSQFRWDLPCRHLGSAGQPLGTTPTFRVTHKDRFCRDVPQEERRLLSALIHANSEQIRPLRVEGNARAWASNTRGVFSPTRHAGAKGDRAIDPGDRHGPVVAANSDDIALQNAQRHSSARFQTCTRSATHQASESLQSGFLGTNRQPWTTKGTRGSWRPAAAAETPAPYHCRTLSRLNRWHA